MKNRFLFLILILSSVFTVRAQQTLSPATTPEMAITYFFDGLSEINDAKMRAYVTHDFLLLENGLVWNIDSLTNAVNSVKEADFKRTNTFNYWNRDVSKDKVILVYHNQADIVYNGKPVIIRWLESAVLIPDKKLGWKIKMLHSTKIPNKNKNEKH